MQPNTSLEINRYLYASTVKEPMLFLAWKHHLPYIKYVVKKNHNSLSNGNKIQLCKRFGTSVIDLYYGYLSPANISEEIFNVIQKAGADTRCEYNSWIDNRLGNYRMITLSDKSSWTIKKCDFLQRFIHIHPSRHSCYTARVKATALKTAVAYCLLFRSKKKFPRVEELNFSRRKLLKLPPLKDDVLYHQIFKLVEYIQQ
ncbi:MAG: hypothetical protein ACLFNU_05440 [Bacteroidales bacterium]